MRSIDIDLDVHRAIENARSNFNQSENDILRELLHIEMREQAARPYPRRSRSSGAYSIVIGKTPVEANTLKDLLKRVLLLLSAHRRDFLVAVERHYATRRGGRRLVARTPEGVFPTSPHLAALAEPLVGEWWFDTNISRDQTSAYIQTLCKLANVSQFSPINKRSTKTPLTVDDLEL